MENFKNSFDDIPNAKITKLTLLFLENQDLFLAEFALTYPKFVHKLSKLCDTLDNRQKLVCGCIKLGIERDKIQQVLFEDNSITFKNYLYRLKMKLDSKRETNIFDFLKNL